MGYLDTKEKRKGFAGTVGVHLLLLVLFAIYGLKYPDPIPVTGIPINFGTIDIGSGEIQPDESGEPKSTASEAAPETPIEEDILTQNDIETVSTPPVEKTDKKKLEPKEKVEKSEPAKDPVPDPTLDSELDKRLKANPFATKGGSEGNDDNKTGDKGQKNGTKAGKAYQGIPGGGVNRSGDYRLGNRSAIAKVIPKYECDEYGTVIMQVFVNRQGVTTEAKLKLKGTTNQAACLVKNAREAALKTKWQSDPSAPANQIGTITYHFELN